MIAVHVLVFTTYSQELLEHLLKMPPREVEQQAWLLPSGVGGRVLGSAWCPSPQYGPCQCLSDFIRKLQSPFSAIGTDPNGSCCKTSGSEKKKNTEVMKGNVSSCSITSLDQSETLQTSFNVSMKKLDSIVSFPREHSIHREKGTNVHQQIREMPHFAGQECKTEICMSPCSISAGYFMHSQFCHASVASISSWEHA